MTEWKIQSRAHVCAACRKSFADHEAYHTLLFDEKAEFRRSDICQNCWQTQYSDGVRDRKGFVSHWQGNYEAPPAKSDAIRKRVLKVKEQLMRQGQRVFLYEQPATGDLFTIIDPNLQLNQLEQVQHDVAALLEHGLNPVEQPVPTAVAPSAEGSGEITE